MIFHIYWPFWEERNWVRDNICRFGRDNLKVDNLKVLFTWRKFFCRFKTDDNLWKYNQMYHFRKDHKKKGTFLIDEIHTTSRHCLQKLRNTLLIDGVFIVDKLHELSWDWRKESDTFINCYQRLLIPCIFIFRSFTHICSISMKTCTCWNTKLYFRKIYTETYILINKHISEGDTLFQLFSASRPVKENNLFLTEINHRD